MLFDMLVMVKVMQVIINCPNSYAFIGKSIFFGLHLPVINVYDFSHLLIVQQSKYV